MCIYTGNQSGRIYRRGDENVEARRKRQRKSPKCERKA